MGVQEPVPIAASPRGSLRVEVAHASRTEQERVEVLLFGGEVLGNHPSPPYVHTHYHEQGFGQDATRFLGLAPGNYLGAVSHSDDDGLLGLTIISVDNS